MGFILFTCLKALFNIAFVILNNDLCIFLSLVDDVVCIYYNTRYTTVLTAFVDLKLSDSYSVFQTKVHTHVHNIQNNIRCLLTIKY